MAQLLMAARLISAKAISFQTSHNLTRVITAWLIGQRWVLGRSLLRHACRCCVTWAWRQHPTMRSTSCRVLKHCLCEWIATGQMHSKLANISPSTRRLKKCFMQVCRRANGMNVPSGMVMARVTDQCWLSTSKVASRLVKSLLRASNCTVMLPTLAMFAAS